jgi:hypothetical protein
MRMPGSFIVTESNRQHLWSGMLRLQEGIGGQVLTNFGLNLEGLRCDALQRAAGP